MSKIKKKTLKYKIEYLIIMGFIKTLMMFPEKSRFKFAEKLGLFGYHLLDLCKK